MLIAPTIAFAQGGVFAGPTVAGIPVEFILFATVLLGVALFHHYTFPIAAGGALAIALYKIFFSPFKTGAGWSGFGLHLLHEWVILINLLLLLLGFALLAKHFEDTTFRMRCQASCRTTGRGASCCSRSFLCCRASLTTSRRR